MKQSLPFVNPSISSRVREKAEELFLTTLENQCNAGVAKYGISLESFNRRDTVVDCVQEMVDAFQYLTQLSMEVDVLYEYLNRLFRIIKGRKFSVSSDEEAELAIAQAILRNRAHQLINREKVTDNAV